MSSSEIVVETLDGNEKFSTFERSFVYDYTGARVLRKKTEVVHLAVCARESGLPSCIGQLYAESGSLMLARSFGPLLAIRGENQPRRAQMSEL